MSGIHGCLTHLNGVMLHFGREMGDTVQKTFLWSQGRVRGKGFEGHASQNAEVHAGACDATHYVLIFALHAAATHLHSKVALKLKFDSTKSHVPDISEPITMVLVQHLHLPFSVGCPSSGPSDLLQLLGTPINGRTFAYLTQPWTGMPREHFCFLHVDCFLHGLPPICAPNRVLAT